MTNRAWWGIGLLVITALAVYLYSSLERYESRRFIDASQEAQLNPYLAAQRYLEQRNVDIVGSEDRLDFRRIPVDDTVFLSHADLLILSQSQVDIAVDWVKQGGFLIVGAGSPVEGYASIMKHYKIEPSEDAPDNQDAVKTAKQDKVKELNQSLEDSSKSLDCQETTDSSPDLDTQGKCEPDDADQIGADSDADRSSKSKPENSEPEKSKSGQEKTRIAKDKRTRALFDFLGLEYVFDYYKAKLRDDEGAYYLASLDNLVLNHPAVNSYDDNDVEDYPGNVAGWISDDFGPRLIQIDDGEGVFTVFSTLRLWQNDYIGLADHARLLSYFVPDGSRVHFFYDVQSPGVMQLIDQYLPEVYYAVLMLLFLWLWRIAMRVQPTEKAEFGHARDFSEHLRASTRFLLQNGHHQVILKSLKDDIDAQMRRSQPGFNSFSKSEQAQLIATQLNLKLDLIESWLQSLESIDNESDFVQAIKVGQMIRNKL